MKVLQLCMRVPHPPADGATIAMHNLAEALMQAGVSLKVLAFLTNKQDLRPVAPGDPFPQRTALETVPLDLSVRPWAAFGNLFTSRSYNVERFDKPAFHDRLAALLAAARYDVVQLEGLFMTPYIDTVRSHSGARVVLRAHNAEHVIWDRLAAACRQPLRRQYMALLARRLKRYEYAVLNRVDALIPITPVDEALFRAAGCRVPSCVIPVGIDVSRYPDAGTVAGPFSMFHLGSMDWLPNLEAVDWFLERVLPGVQAELPDARVYLAGKDMPDRIRQRAGKQLVVEGRIDQADRYMQHKQVMIVPLLSGGGMRVKIIEGMAAGKAIVSTTVGAEGIGYTDGKNIVIADTPAAFREALVMLARDPARCRAIGTEARKLAAAEYDNRLLGERLVAFYRDLAP